MSLQKLSRKQYNLESHHAGKAYTLLLDSPIKAAGIHTLLIGTLLLTSCMNSVNVAESNRRNPTAVNSERTEGTNDIGCTNKQCVINNKCGCGSPYSHTLPVIAPRQPVSPVKLIIDRVRGAITARSDVILTGSVTVDGREYDLFNNLVGAGIYGVYSCGMMRVYGGADIGGNGIAPVTKSGLPPVRSIVSKENAPGYWYYLSPEAFLGLAPGSLDEYRIPASEFTTPFDGIVYVTEDLGPFDFHNSKGILIVHNQQSNAELTMAYGSFKGLIICDVMHRINGLPEILGAVVTLSPDIESRFGNGSADIHYSLEILQGLTAYFN